MTTETKIKNTMQVLSEIVRTVEEAPDENDSEDLRLTKEYLAGEIEIHARKLQGLLAELKRLNFVIYQPIN